MRRPRTRALVLVLTLLIALGAPTALARQTDGAKGNSCPEPTPGFGFTPAPGCGHERTTTTTPTTTTPTTTPTASCLSAPPGNISVEVPSLANVCVVLYVLEGTGAPVCPAGAIVVPVTGVPDVVAVCATVQPAPPPA